MMSDSIPVFKFALRDGLTEEFLPKKSTDLATGWDVFAAQEDRKTIFLKRNQYVKIPLGFFCSPPDGWWYEVHPRSSLFFKKFCRVLEGVIDEDFPLECGVLLQYLPSDDNNKDLVIEFGSPIAQIIPVKRVNMHVEHVSLDTFKQNMLLKQSNRVGGIGSTG